MDMYEIYILLNYALSYTTIQVMTCCEGNFHILVIFLKLLILLIRLLITFLNSVRYFISKKYTFLENNRNKYKKKKNKKMI